MTLSCVAQTAAVLALLVAAPSASLAAAVCKGQDCTGEGIKATLYGAAGKQVDQRDDITQAQQSEVTLPTPSRRAIWSLKTEHATHAFLEDYYIELPGLPPLLAPSPEALLAAK